MYVCGLMDGWMDVCMHVCIYVCMYVCMNVWMNVCINVCMYEYICAIYLSHLSILLTGISAETLRAWSIDPQVKGSDDHDDDAVTDSSIHTYIHLCIHPSIFLYTYIHPWQQ